MYFQEWINDVWRSEGKNEKFDMSKGKFFIPFHTYNPNYLFFQLGEKNLKLFFSLSGKCTMSTV